MTATYLVTDGRYIQAHNKTILFIGLTDKRTNNMTVEIDTITRPCDMTPGMSWLTTRPHGLPSPSMSGVGVLDIGGVALRDYLSDQPPSDKGLGGLPTTPLYRGGAQC